MKNTLTQNYLKENLDYNPTTGIFNWKVSNNNRIKVHDIAGSVRKDGYIHIRINGKDYRAHRLAYLYITGSFPLNQVDHINHSRDDNRFSNLRLVSNQENQRNRSMRVNNKSGFTGVCWDKCANKWKAQIKANGKVKYLGSFTDLAEAIDCRKKANVEYGFHTNHGRV
jgi:hypothetical protein